MAAPKVGKGELAHRFAGQDNAPELQRGHTLPEYALTELYARTQGWAAGLILTLEQAAGRDSIEDVADLSTPQLVFDYLAGEVFQKTDTRTQTFVLNTAYLPQMTADMATSMTGESDAGVILAHMSARRHQRALCLLSLRQIDRRGLSSGRFLFCRHGSRGPGDYLCTGNKYGTLAAAPLGREAPNVRKNRAFVTVVCYGHAGWSCPSGRGGLVQRGGVSDMCATGARCLIEPNGDAVSMVMRASSSSGSSF